MVLGSGIRDPGSGKNLFRIPDPGVQKHPDPGSGSATLVADPGSGAFFYPWILDPGWVESQHPDPGFWMNNPDHIFWSLETIFFG